jgi:mannose-6-phosphate isomerase
LLIAEIQQNSNTTYRVYDWKRVGSDGTPRQLHVARALDVINFDQAEPVLSIPQLSWRQDGICAYLLCQNDYFITERLEFAPGTTYRGYNNGESMEIWGIIEGDATIEGGGLAVNIYQVRFVLLPAAMGRFTVRARSSAQFLRTTLPPSLPE